MAGTGSIITLDQLTEQTTLTKKDWIAVLSNTTKKTGKASFATLTTLLQADFYTKKEIIDLLKKGQSGGAFDWNRAITQGTYAGVTPGGTSVTEGLENLFYAPQPPQCSLYADSNPRQFGAPTGVVLHYDTLRKSNDIASVVVNGVTQTTNAGTVVTNLSANTDTTFNMSVTDINNLSSTASTTVVFKHKRFWFTSATDLLSLSDAQVSGALLTQQAEFADGKEQTRTFSPTNEYIYCAWLSDYGQAQFVTNGLGDTDFIQKLFAFTNSDQYTTSFNLVRKGLKLNNKFTIQVK